MVSLDFDWQTNEFMLYCRTTQLREKSMMAYEQPLKLFGRWCMKEMGIFTVDKVTENVIRRYIMKLQERGKYTCCIVKAYNVAGSPVLTRLITNKRLVQAGYYSILARYELLHLCD